VTRARRINVPVRKKRLKWKNHPRKLALVDIITAWAHNRGIHTVAELYNRRTELTKATCAAMLAIDPQVTPINFKAIGQQVGWAVDIQTDAKLLHTHPSGLKSKSGYQALLSLKGII